jgi:hydrogenase maturation protease
MNRALLDQIVNAVLYEGYILYPYRPSVKNRQRWTFGGIYPRAHSEMQTAGDPGSMQTEVLLRGRENTRLSVEVRFLHLMSRLVGKLEHSLAELAEGEELIFQTVEQLTVGDRLLQTWQEATPREVVPELLDIASLVDRPERKEFTFPASRKIEPVRGPGGLIDAILVREQQPVTGRVEVVANRMAPEIFKLQVRIENHTELEQSAKGGRDQAVLQSLASTHTILGAEDGEFISLIDPPDSCRGLAALCRNEGTWPVLVGEAGECDTMLSSPITLYDYPQIAAESPGDFFDGTEIDELLVLRVLTLTEEEKQAAAAVDDRARALLERTQSLGADQVLGLHGAVRGMRPAQVENLHE